MPLYLGFSLFFFITELLYCRSATKFATAPCHFLARSANLPKGLYILLSVICSFFIIFLLGAKLSQYLLDRFSRSFHQMEDIYVSSLGQVQFFRFLKGRCHDNQFCIVSKTQTTCDFCNFYTVWKGFGYRWQIWNYFFNISRDVAMATNFVNG